MHKLLNKNLLLCGVGGLRYVMIELRRRGPRPRTLLSRGGLCTPHQGMINEDLHWETPLWLQILIGAAGITALEFLTGCIVNLWLGWWVWDYSSMPGNLLGQICPQYVVLWFPVSLAGIVLDDWIRYLTFGEQRPR